MILIFGIAVVLGVAALVVIADQARPYRIDREQPDWDLFGKRWKR